MFVAKGITQDQVNAAADDLVAASEKPTVERVRAQLGTGSPNTVLRMLDVWRGGLAQRLQDVMQLPEMPAEVGQAAISLWRQALTHAETLARERLTGEAVALAQAQAALADERAGWMATLEKAHVDAEGAMQARDVALTRLADQQRLVEQQANQVKELLQQRDAWQQRAELLDEAFEAHKSSLADERNAQATHLRAVEDRAHSEIDRTREEMKALQALVRRKEREASDASTELQKALSSLRTAERLAAEQATRAGTLEQQLARMDGIPKALTEAQSALRAAVRRETALRSKLERRPVDSRVLVAPRNQKPRASSKATATSRPTASKKR
jgi:chromosome segregation ATPase